MKTITVEITDKQYEYLQNIIHEDAAGTDSEALQYVLHSARNLEENYQTDVCDLYYRDIRTGDKFPQTELIDDEIQFRAKRRNFMTFRTFSRYVKKANSILITALLMIILGGLALVLLSLLGDTFDKMLMYTFYAWCFVMIIQTICDMIKQYRKKVKPVVDAANEMMDRTAHFNSEIDNLKDKKP